MLCIYKANNLNKSNNKSKWRFGVANIIFCVLHLFWREQLFPPSKRVLTIERSRFFLESVGYYLNVVQNPAASDFHTIGTDQLTVHVLSSFPLATSECDHNYWIRRRRNHSLLLQTIHYWEGGPTLA